MKSKERIALYKKSKEEYAKMMLIEFLEAQFLFGGDDQLIDMLDEDLDDPEQSEEIFNIIVNNYRKMKIEFEK